MASTAIGGLFSAAGTEQQAQATAQTYNYQAAVARINSQIDLQNADFARQQGEQTALQSGMQARQQLGQIRADQGASGLNVAMGSAAGVQASQKYIAGFNAANIRNNAAKTAYDYDVKSTMDLNQSTLDTMGAANAITAGNLSATASILGTVGSVSSKWLSGSTSGMFAGIGGWGGGSGTSSGAGLLSGMGLY